MCRELKGMKIYDSVAIKCGSVSYNDLHIYNITDDENEYMKIILKNCGVKEDLNKRRRRRFSFIYYNTVLLSLVKLNMLLAVLNRKNVGKVARRQKTN